MCGTERVALTDILSQYKHTHCELILLMQNYSLIVRYSYHQVEGFLQLAEMEGHGSLSNTSCLLSATSCLPEASIFHRKSTYHQLLWTSLKARSVLLSLLHKTNKKEAALRHCQELSALITHSGLEASPKLRALQMQVSWISIHISTSTKILE